MATQSDKAKRAAATKALRQRQQELEDQVLIESTRRKLFSPFISWSLLTIILR
jgi:hypothetical protein